MSNAPTLRKQIAGINGEPREEEPGPIYRDDLGLRKLRDQRVKIFKATEHFVERNDAYAHQSLAKSFE